MPRPTRLDDATIQSKLQQFGGWELKEGKLHREFNFADFVEAFRFMTAVALVAERMNHHPEWFNVYRTVIVDLRTHDADGISELDFKLASEIDKLALSA
jgi:4a-hydroxytetrahydrobiopterin dehydratase